MMWTLKRKQSTTATRMLIFVVLSLLLFWVAVGEARADGPIYVDADYSGVETGSETQPFNTLQEANDASVDGEASLIYIKAGTTQPYAAVEIDHGGAGPDEPDVYAVWPGSGSYPRIASDTANQIIFSAPYVTIDGLDVDGSAGSSTRDLITSAPDHQAAYITIRNCKVHDSAGDEGIQLKSARYSRIENVESYNNDGDGINLCCASDHSVVIGNYSHDNQGSSPPHGGFYFYDVSDLLVADNVAAHNREAGIHFDDTVTEAVVRNNLVISTTIYDPEEGFGIWLHHNADLSHIYLSNNTIVGSQFDGIRLSSGAYITVTDNIVVASGANGIRNSGAISVSNDYNLVWNSGNTDWTGLASGSHSLSLDPQFVAGSRGLEPDYYLGQTASGQAIDSPALNAGSRTALAAALDSRTTRTDGGKDVGTVDLGYHYAAFAPQLSLAAVPTAITADGVSTSTLTAMASTIDGDPVADGTTVVFTTSLGRLDNYSQVYTTTTQAGSAVAHLAGVPSRTSTLAVVGAGSGDGSDSLEVNLQPPTCAADLTSWSEYPANPIFGEGVNGGPKAYYPAVLYSPTAFDGHGDSNYYKLWFGTEDSRTGYAVSDDGLTWTVVISQLDSIGGYHAHVLYDADRFSDDSAYYKMWYWDVNNSVNYATSDDGVTWTNYPANPVITNALAWGSAPVYDAFVIYNTDGQPAAYEAWIDNNGKIYYVTSSDGINWNGDNQELLADRQPGEMSTYSRVSVLKLDGAYFMWYGASDGNGGNQSIRYAASSDGRRWQKSLDNPLLSMDDGVTWRNNRTYTPRVLYSPTRFDGHGSPEQFKMWFTGKDNDSGNYAIGFARLNPVHLSLADTSGSGQEETAGNALSLPFVVGLRDACGEAAADVTASFSVSGSPAGATGHGLSVAQGATDSSGQLSTRLTLGHLAGVYTITAASTGVLDMPAVFTATARAAAPAPEGNFVYLPMVFKSPAGD